MLSSCWLTEKKSKHLALPPPFSETPICLQKRNRFWKRNLGIPSAWKTSVVIFVPKKLDHQLEGPPLPIFSHPVALEKKKMVLISSYAFHL